MSVITARGLTKRYGDHAAVVDVGFTVDRGELVAMLGPNGAGKTTTVEILEGLQDRTGGEVEVLGVDPGHATRAWRGQVGLLLQHSGLDRELTVRETLDFYAGLYPRPRPVDEVLAEIGLTAEAKVRIGQLSGGQQRRADLGAAIIGNPQVLFLDEPTTGFDPEARRSAWAIIERLKASSTTIILTTHYLEEARRLADRIIVLVDGRVVADDTPDGIRGLVHARTTVSLRLPATGAPPPLPADGTAEVSGREVRIQTTDAPQLLRELLDWSQQNGQELDELSVTPGDFEEVYLALTGKEHADV